MDLDSCRQVRRAILIPSRHHFFDTHPGILLQKASFLVRNLRSDSCAFNPEKGVS
jgi:hypothetical protein